MSRRIFLALAVVVAAAGCAVPDRVDGDLVGAWPAMPPPEQVVPEVGVCHVADYKSSVRMYLYRPVSCGEQHLLETVHVGLFEGEIAQRSSPPEQGTSQWRVAYDECDRGAADYLGADFRHGWLWLGVVVPTEAAWRGGARWFRCDIRETGRTMHWVPIWPGSRRDALTVESPLSLGCFLTEDADDGGVTLRTTECTEPHNAEFVGLWRSEAVAYPESEQEVGRVHAGCWERVVAYVDGPADGDLPYPTGTVFDPISEEDWDNGDRSFRCYLWLDDRTVTSSLAGGGS